MAKQITAEEYANMLMGRTITDVKYGVDADIGGPKFRIVNIWLDHRFELEFHGVHDDTYLEFIWEHDENGEFVEQYSLKKGD